MSHDIKRLTDFLLEQGIDRVAHTGKTYLAHLVGVYRDLESWGAEPDVCRAGMFHSIYGTERFRGFTLPLEKREQIRALIGERAERLAYVNCAMDRATFDQAVQRGGGPIRDRITGEEVHLSPADFNALCQVHLCDWLEQVPRSKEWGYRRPAYRQMAERLGGMARESYDRVFAQESALSGA